MSAPAVRGASVLSIWYWKQLAIWAGLFKRDDVAIEYWERILAARPGDSSVVATVAHMKAQAGGRREAVALLQRAVELDPESAHAWFNLGFLQQEEQRHDEALASFERALVLDPKLDRAWYGKALSLIKSGRPQEAVAPLKRNTELQPMSPYGFYQLAHVYHKLEDKDGVARTIRKLAEFEPKVAKQLERETGVHVGVVTEF